jgi:hypothetical protein
VQSLALLLLFHLPIAAADYAGADACRTCHPSEFESQSRSAHAHALAPSAAPQPGEWAFGAGIQAITFVSHPARDTYRELGQTWYRSLNAYAVTPGHRTPDGIDFRTFDPAARILRCFSCHSTGPPAVDSEDRVVPHELGVRCEVCHAPAAAHVRNPALNRLRTPATLSAVALNAFCANCHHLDRVVGEELLDLRDPATARSQPLRLAAAACFRNAKGRLTCLTCHSPHDPLEQKLETYNAACQGCHAAPRHTEPIARRPCAGCHMPSIRLDNLVFTNHQIAVYSPANPIVPLTNRR